MVNARAPLIVHSKMNARLALVGEGLLNTLFGLLGEGYGTGQDLFDVSAVVHIIVHILRLADHSHFLYILRHIRMYLLLLPCIRTPRLFRRQQ